VVPGALTRPYRQTIRLRASTLTWWPCRSWPEGFGAVLKVTQQVRAAQLVVALAQLGRVVVLVPVVHDHAGQVGDDEH
jgi:hypothetical protein